MKIDCTDFRKYLDAYFDGELADPERGEFDAHIAVCGDCRKHYAQRAWFQGAIRPALRRSCSLSEGARARLQDSLVGARRQLRRRSMIRRLAPVVPAAVAVGAVFMLVTPLTGFVPVIDEAVEQHCEQAPVEVPTPETDELEGWFAGKLPFRFQAPRFRQQEGVMLLGGSPASPAPRRRAGRLRTWSMASAATSSACSSSTAAASTSATWGASRSSTAARSACMTAGAIAWRSSDKGSWRTRSPPICPKSGWSI